ncbi:MAG TPA: magnesium/cobalt transporter CorA [Flavipsychrobacter sp.]|nr:magnesium/cobalt transporter CorA [Flavipsychrobacter sp.]
MGLLKQANKIVHLLPDWTWNYFEREPITHFNPAKDLSEREEPLETAYTVYTYNEDHFEEHKFTNEDQCERYKRPDRVTWINVDGLKKKEVENLCASYDIHSLLVEDILSVGQRAKMDEIGDIIFCLLPMLYYNEGTGAIETEQVSIVLGKHFVLSFQEDPERDVFDPVRTKLRIANPKLRANTADYLCYSLIDVIVDSYFAIIEKLNERVERLEDALLLNKERNALTKISILRREIMLLRRSIMPVRDLVNGIVKSDNEVLEERNEKYFKDVLDHITQANDYVENHRDMLMNLQDLSMSQINTRLNEVMKVFTLLATLMAPATVIGGIFGMNFDVIPLAHHVSGFYITVGLMIVIPLVMLVWFKRKGWF